LLPSPNFNARTGAGRVMMLILHYTGMESEEAALARLRDEQAQVSAHYVVTQTGTIIQMVAEKARAWHAGKSCWQGERDINSCSIGIEIVNQGPLGNFPDYPDKQIESVIDLCRDIIKRHDIASAYVLGHSDIAPGRKIDPGEKFPWGRLAEAGIGHYVEPVMMIEGEALSFGMKGDKVAQWQQSLADYGYGVMVNGEFDTLTHDVTQAFQRHFRTCRVDGTADVSTRQTLQLLLDGL